jgi:hypothetical protein
MTTEELVIQSRSLGDQVRYYADQVQALANVESADPNWDLMGLAMAMRMTANNIDAYEAQWAGKTEG